MATKLKRGNIRSGASSRYTEADLIERFPA
jgi:hypothetical protein